MKTFVVLCILAAIGIVAAGSPGFEVLETETFNMSLVEGYNLISIPLNDPDVPDAAALFDKIGEDALEIYKWNKGTQLWESYNAYMPREAAFPLECGEGYFLRMNGDAEITFTGEPWNN